MDSKDTGPAGVGPPSKPDRIDAYLSRRAQDRFDPRALVLERADGSWIIHLVDGPPRMLGHSFPDARQALDVLIRASESVEFDQEIDGVVYRVAFRTFGGFVTEPPPDPETQRLPVWTVSREGRLIGAVPMKGIGATRRLVERAVEELVREQVASQPDREAER